MPNHTELLELLLRNRGILPENWDKFLNPEYKDLYDPFLLKDLEKACVRIFEAVDVGEKIMIYSDYDCDGIPSAVIMHDFFKKIGYENFEVYIPDRHDEGYGLHHDAILEFIEKRIDLLVTLDLGITAIEEVATAQASGMDVIIVDHHLVKEDLPRAFAIVNPKQKDCKYPDEMLCACGVTFKLINGLIKKYGEYWKISEGWEKWMLDMAGLSTLADQVPLLNENRILAFYGLKVLRKTKRPGLMEVFRKANVDITRLNEEDITFTLAPKINVASRMDSPMRAFELLSTKNITEAKTLADHLIKINDERKYLVAQIMKEVKKVLSKKEDREIIVIGNPKWRIGVLGIVASKIAEEYKKPAFVWGSDGQSEIHGSCRTWGNVNMNELMSSLPENSLVEFGGHAGAGGFAVSHEEIHMLEERLLSAFSKNVSDSLEDEIQKIDAQISLDDVNIENYKVIEKLAPYGMGNPKPTFLLKNIKIESIKEFGKEKNHLELSFLNSNDRTIKAIAFFKTRETFSLKIGDYINLIATFEKNTFGGKNELRLRIVDII